MIAHLFLHVSRAISNRQDLPSLILEKIDGKSLLHRQLDRFKNLRRFKQINIVTSELEIDLPIVECANCFKENNPTINVEVIRIPQSSVYAFSESNRIIGDNFLYKKPLFGFFNAQFLNEYATAHSIEAALLAIADDVPLIEAELLDSILTKYGCEGISYGTRFPGERILIVPTHDLHAKITAYNYNKEKKIKEEIEKIKESVNDIQNVKKTISIEEIIKQQVSNLEKIGKLPISCDDILSLLHETGYTVQVNAQNRYQFFPVHRQRDADFLKELLPLIDVGSLDNFSAVQTLVAQRTNRIAPVTLEVELTSRTNCDDALPPFTLLNHAEKDLSSEQFCKIIDTFSDDVLYLVLDGFGEPTLHPNLLEYIHYASERSFFRICLKTNGCLLNDDMISKLLQSELDILIIDLDEYDAAYAKAESPDCSYPSEKLMAKILEVRASLNKKTPYILVQCMNSISNQKNVQYYYNRWTHIADAVVIQPHNDYSPTPSPNELIDLAPLGQPTNCFKTTQTLLILANGKPVLCKQKPDGFQPSKKNDLHEIWLDNYLQGGTFDFCKQCVHKYYREGMQPDKFISTFNFAIQNAVYSTLPAKILSQYEQSAATNDHEAMLESLEHLLQFHPDNSSAKKLLDNFTA